MPSWVDITGPAFLLLGNIISRSRGRRKVEGIGRSGWRTNCGWNVFCERRINE